jgi:hypothetical protein
MVFRLFGGKIMEKTIRAIDRENEFKGFCNEEAAEIDYSLALINDHFSLSLQNIFPAYKKKVWEFVDFFEKHGLLYFDDSCYLRLFVSSFLHHFLAQWHKSFLLYQEYLSKPNWMKIVFKDDLKRAIDGIQESFDTINSFQIVDLPGFFLDTILDKNLYQCFLPDCHAIFIDECMREFTLLGFDVEKEFDLGIIEEKRREMEDESAEAIVRDGLAIRREKFIRFIDDYKLDISSSLLSLKQ